MTMKLGRPNGAKTAGEKELPVLWKFVEAVGGSDKARNLYDEVWKHLVSTFVDRLETDRGFFNRLIKTGAVYVDLGDRENLITDALACRNESSASKILYAVREGANECAVRTKRMKVMCKLGQVEFEGLVKDFQKKVCSKCREIISAYCDAMELCVMFIGTVNMSRHDDFVDDEVMKSVPDRANVLYDEFQAKLVGFLSKSEVESCIDLFSRMLRDANILSGYRFNEKPNQLKWLNLEKDFCSRVQYLIDGYKDANSPEPLIMCSKVCCRLEDVPEMKNVCSVFKGCFVAALSRRLREKFSAMGIVEKSEENEMGNHERSVLSKAMEEEGRFAECIVKDMRFLTTKVGKWQGPDPKDRLKLRDMVLNESANWFIRYHVNMSLIQPDREPVDMREILEMTLKRF